MTAERAYVPIVAPPTTVTADDLIERRIPDKHVELVRGVLMVRELPGYTHGRIAAALGFRLGAHIEQTGANLVLLRFRALFAADLPERQTRVLAVTQKPLAATAFGETLDQAAWRTIPSWFLVAREDQAINPDLERFMARRMGARTSEIRSSHVPFASHPNKVAELIEEAASAGHE